MKLQAIAEAQRFYDASIDRTKYSVNDVKFKLNSKGNGIAAWGDVEIHASLLKVVGIQNVKVLSSNIPEAAVAEAGGGTPTGDLEVSLMLDVTGSMCDDNNGPCTSGAKISALKAAAADLVETVVWDDQKTYTSRLPLFHSRHAFA